MSIGALKVAAREHLGNVRQVFSDFISACSIARIFALDLNDATIPREKEVMSNFCL